MEDLRKFFDIFNAILFNGILTGYEGHLHWYRRPHYGSEAAYCQYFFVGKERDPRYRLQQPLGPIWIQKRMEAYPLKKIGNYLNLLAHEMLHAVFIIYACSCSNGCYERHCEAIDWTGHCASWQAAGYAIEKATKVRFISDDGPLGLLPLNLSLSRDGSFAFALQRGCDMPEDVELQRLGLNIELIRKRVAEYGVEEAETCIKQIRQQQLRKANNCLRSWSIDLSDPMVLEEWGVGG